MTYLIEAALTGFVFWFLRVTGLMPDAAMLDQAYRSFGELVDEWSDRGVRREQVDAEG